MKQFKIAISIILSAVLIISAFSACKGNGGKGENKGGKEGETVIVAVTDENGEEVTDANGEVVTEAVPAEDAPSESEGGVVIINGDSNKTDTEENEGSDSKKTDKKNKKKDKKDSKKEDDKAENEKDKKEDKKKDKEKEKEEEKETIKKPAKPEKPSKFKASGVTKDSLTLSWDAVKCDAYELEMRENGKEWKSLKKAMTATAVSLKEYLKPYTIYFFRVRAFNENEAGRSASDWAEINVRTKADEKYKRFITVRVKLPFDSKKKDKVKIYIKKQGKDEKYVLVHEKDVILDGSTVKYTTTEKYEGVVSVKAVLADLKASAKTETNSDSCRLTIVSGIENDIDDEEI